MLTFRFIWLSSGAKNFAGRGLEPVRLGVCPLYIQCAPEGGNDLQMRARKFLLVLSAGSYWAEGIEKWLGERRQYSEGVRTTG